MKRRQKRLNRKQVKQQKVLATAKNQLKQDKKDLQKLHLTADTRLSRKDKKRLADAFQKARRDGKVPKSAQQTIPYLEMYKNGVCMVKKNYFTKQIQFYDINYQLAQNEDKNIIFENYCDFLNYFDNSIHFELSFLNQRADMEEFKASIDIPMREDAFNLIRKEYAAMLKNQLSRGNNGLVKTK